MQNRPSWSWS